MIITAVLIIWFLVSPLAALLLGGTIKLRDQRG